ncbi:hypothetical protein [Calothrix sp. UHCC 0171]|uniref:hypothetical protein n=1 Tax=Calothrix sp. UHCC 0171 TaxID=3110245 RepID=UPI003A5219AF
MAFNLNGLNFNLSILDSTGAVIRTEADMLNRAMHAPNVYHFPVVMSAGELIPEN